MCRCFYCFFALFSLCVGAHTAADEPQRGFATLDWTVAETLIALGEAPLAVGDAAHYAIWVGEPKLPADILDLGVRLQPNPEQIWRLAQSPQAQPLIFINTGFYAQTATMLRRFGQVHQVDFAKEDEAWQNVVNATQQVAQLIGKPQAAEALLQRYWQKIREITPAVAPFTARPVALVQFIDSRHLRIYGKNSLFGAVLTQLGVENAWQEAVNSWGFSTIEVTQLASLPPQSRFVVIKPYPANIQHALAHNTLWQKLAMAQDPLILPSIWTFGAIPSAQRFAEAFAHALQQGGEAW